MMLTDDPMKREWRPSAPTEPTLSEMTRLRLGQHLKALYEPIIDEALDPRLAELMRQLDADREV